MNIDFHFYYLLGFTLGMLFLVIVFILFRELFEKAQAVITQRRKQYGVDMNNSDKYSNRYVFSNKSFCGECGCRLTPS